MMNDEFRVESSKLTVDSGQASPLPSPKGEGASKIEAERVKGIYSLVLL